MDSTVLIALITVGGTIVSAIISTLINNKLTIYRIEQLEKKVEKHNNLIERTYKIESEIEVIENEIHNL